MLNHRADHRRDNKIIFQWFLLSFNAGCINAGGFLATGRFVSHVTGFATLFGVDLIHDQPESALGILSVPIFFLMGSFIAGLLVDRPIYRRQKPHLDYVMGLSALCLLFAAGAGWIMKFGGLSGEVVRFNDLYLLLSLLCLACGLQNGAITSTSGSTVRTTHLTGLTTDLGLGLARLLTIRCSDLKYTREIYANHLRFGTILSFVIGSAIGCFLFVRSGYPGFLLSALIAFYIAWEGRKAKIHAHKQKFI